MKVVIDSNIFIMCVNPLSRFNLVFTGLIYGAYELCISTDISFEYSEICNQKFSHRKAEILNRIFLESKNVIANEIYYYWNIISSDPDDNKFVDCSNSR